MKSLVLRIFIICILILILSACATTSDTDEEIRTSRTATSAPSTGVMTRTPTPLLSVGDTAEPTLQNTPGAMRFSLPTPGSQPVTAWRPPLYPVPWAVSPFDHFYFTSPISVDQMNQPDADYRYGGVFFKPGAVHTGIDIPADLGTTVHAAGAGEVIWAGWGLYTGDSANKQDPYGLAIVILHDFGYQDQQLFTVYAHLDKVYLEPGDRVKIGDPLGTVGETGYTTGPHLHFEVRIGENSYFTTSNPELWLVPPQGLGIMVMRITDSYNNPLPDLEVNLRSEVTRTEWVLNTYPAFGVFGDSYYQENLTLSDLPAGSYTITFNYYGKQKITIQILPGQITYRAYRGLLYGFGMTPPPTDRTDFYLTPIP